MQLKILIKKKHASEKLSLVVRRGLEREEIENRPWARQEVRGARLRKCQLKLEKKWEGSQKPYLKVWLM